MHSKQLSQKLKPSIEFEALGTQWFIEADHGISVEKEQLIRETLEGIDRTWSRFRSDSLVARMSRSAGEYELPSADRRLMEWYHQLYLATDGRVNPLIGQTLSDAGYDASYRLVPKQEIAKTPSWDSTIQLTKSSIQLKHPALLDVGAAGKGYAIDAIAAILQDMPAYMIDAGGDIYIHGKTQTIGLENPRVQGELIGTVSVSDKSICGSAGNRRQWGEWHHIINPKTSQPVRNILATWAIADNAMYADGIASALFFLPPEKLTQLGNFMYIIMYDDGKVYHTDTSDIQLFT